MNITNLNKQTESAYFVCLEEWNDNLKMACSIKHKWFHRMKTKGLRVKTAVTDEDIPVGMIEYIPIEYSCAEGCDLYIVNCI